MFLGVKKDFSLETSKVTNIGRILDEPCKRLEVPRIATLSNKAFENLSTIYHPDDLAVLYQNHGKGLVIPQLNLDLKKVARNKSLERLTKIEEYCRNHVDEDHYLNLANKNVEYTNKFLYYDFYYAFLYCQTQKVSF